MQLTVHMFVSLDGVVQGPGGPEEDTTGGFTQGGWVVPFVDEEFGAIVDGWFGKVGEFLFGRTTYAMMAEAWTQVTDPDDTVAAVLNAKPKHVVSTTMSEAAWSPTSIISADAVRAIADLKQRPGDELQVHGSGQLVHALHAAGLIDEYRIVVFPVVLGAGKRLFPDDGLPTGFRVVDATTTSSGLVSLALRPAPFRRGVVEIDNGQEVIRVED